MEASKQGRKPIAPNNTVVKDNNIVIFTTTGAITTAACILLSLLIAGPSLAAERIYKQIDENGNVVFTDVPPRPGEAAETVEVEVTAPNSFETPQAQRFDSGAWIVDPADGEEPVEGFSYVSSRITSPADDESLRENAGNVTVAAEIIPSLRAGHQLRLVIDAATQQLTRTPHFQLTNVDRGTHIARVDVVDAAGNVLFNGQSSTFHLQRVSNPTVVVPAKPAPPTAPPPPPARPPNVRRGN